MSIEVRIHFLSKVKSTKRNFVTLGEAQSFAQKYVGTKPTIIQAFNYAINTDKNIKVTCSGNATIKQLFPNDMSKFVEQLENFAELSLQHPGENGAMSNLIGSLTCQNCDSKNYKITCEYSEDAKWVKFTRLCDPCKEAIRLQSVTKPAVYGPLNVDANGSPVTKKEV